jgi:hypothetical protein
MWWLGGTQSCSGARRRSNRCRGGPASPWCLLSAFAAAMVPQPPAQHARAAPDRRMSIGGCRAPYLTLLTDLGHRQPDNRTPLIGVCPCLSGLGDALQTDNWVLSGPHPAVRPASLAAVFSHSLGGQVCRRECPLLATRLEVGRPRWLRTAALGSGKLSGQHRILDGQNDCVRPRPGGPPAKEKRGFPL